MDTRTKIVCTIGPAVEQEEQIISLISAGMNVARINFSHGDHTTHSVRIERLKKIRSQLKVPLSIMLDTKGPEIRIGKMPENGLTVHAGDVIPLISEDLVGSTNGICVRPALVLDHLIVGSQVLIDNGYIIARVIKCEPGKVFIEFMNDGVITSSKGVNIPHSKIPIPAVTEKDVLDIELGCKLGIDMIAASFIRTKEHVLEIKKLLHKFSSPHILVIAKIENHEGIQNFESILQATDGIMVARGDLGVEIPLEQVPHLQKMMIRASNLAGKPVVTATQMLESMIQNPRPTRAEVSDVANAIYDGTSAVMLSGETAVGKYPIQTVSIMKSVIKESEKDFDYTAFYDMHSKMRYSDIASALTLASVETAYSLGAKAIFTFSQSGATARLLSRLKPNMPIIAFTTQATTYHQLGLSWGVKPVLCKKNHSSLDEAFEEASHWSVKQGLLSYGDLVVVTTGTPFWVPGTSNTILVENIGNVLLSGAKGTGNSVYGTISLLGAPLSLAATQGSIVVLDFFDSSLAPLLRQAAGILLQNDPDDLTSEELLLNFCKKENKSAIVRVDGAFHLLREGQPVTLEPEKALVYKGIRSSTNYPTSRI